MRVLAILVLFTRLPGPSKAEAPAAEPARVVVRRSRRPSTGAGIRLQRDDHRIGDHAPQLRRDRDRDPGSRRRRRRPSPRATLLAEIDDTSYRKAYEMTKAAEKQAEDAFNRLSRMYKNGNLPEIKYVEVETGLQKARAAAAIAKKNVDDCRLYAPTPTDYVGKRAIEPGMVAMPNLDSITIVRIDKVFARVPIPENDIALLHKGDRAMIRIGALGLAGIRRHDRGYRRHGRPHGPLLQDTDRRRQPRPDHQARHGLHGGRQGAGKELRPGHPQPSRSGRRDRPATTSIASTGPGSKASVRYVKLGELLQNGIGSPKDLSAGDSVVVSGQHKLVDGAAVQVVER